MEYNTIKLGTFIERPNRFIAKVIIDGEIQTVHVKNTGRCKELLIKGVKVYLEDFGEDMRDRKTRYSLIAVVKNNNMLINMDSQSPNKVVAEALKDGSIILPGLKSIDKIQAEKTFGASRFDFFVEGGGRQAYIEVKGVTLENNGLAQFPDAPTERGVKHINELVDAYEQGFMAYIIFVIQMKGIISFSPNDETHLAFGNALRSAIEKGVNVLVYDCNVTESSLRIDKPIKFCI